MGVTIFGKSTSYCNPIIFFKMVYNFAVSCQIIPFEPLLLKLNCLDDFDSIVMIEIEYAQTVSSLKKAIKNGKKNTFKNINTNTLILWKVAPVDLSKRLKNTEFKDEQQLLPIKHLSEHFLKFILQRRLHIVIYKGSVSW